MMGTPDNPNLVLVRFKLLDKFKANKKRNKSKAKQREGHIFSLLCFILFSLYNFNSKCQRGQREADPEGVETDGDMGDSKRKIPVAPEAVHPTTVPLKLVLQ